MEKYKSRLIGGEVDRPAEPPSHAEPRSRPVNLSRTRGDSNYHESL
jgi:hypothetical protein